MVVLFVMKKSVFRFAENSKNTRGSTKRKVGSNISSWYAVTNQKMKWRSLRVWKPFLVKLMGIVGILKGWKNISKMPCAQIEQLIHFIFITAFFQPLPYLTIRFQCTLSPPPENIRKSYGLMMFSGGKERVHWERMC